MSTIDRDGSIWSSLEASARAAPTGGNISEARRVTAGGVAPLFRAIDVVDFRRRLLIGLPAAEQRRLPDLPSWRGLSIRDQRLNVADIHDGRFLVLEQQLPGTEAMYEAIIGSICNRLVEVTRESDLIPALAQELGAWRAFFDEFGFSGLTDDARLGLYGEVWFLHDYLVSRIGAERAVIVWAGPTAAHHDFQSGLAAVEFKTTVAKQHLVVHIASERQLDDIGLDALYLVVLLVNRLEEGGETLPRAIERLRTTLVDSLPAAANFERRLRATGYLNVHADHYTDGYVFRSLHAYRVSAGFPRLLDGDLPTGVGDLHYSVALAACAAYELPVQDMLRDLTGRWT